MTTLLIVAALFVLLVLAHGLWVLAYARSPRRTLDQRLEAFAKRD